MTAVPVPKSPPLAALTLRQVAWILGGGLLTLATVPGQTLFITQLNTALRAEFGPWQGACGGLYTVATLTSAEPAIAFISPAPRQQLADLTPSDQKGLGVAALRA